MSCGGDGSDTRLALATGANSAPLQSSVDWRHVETNVYQRLSQCQRWTGWNGPPPAIVSFLGLFAPLISYVAHGYSLFLTLGATKSGLQ